MAVKGQSFLYMSFLTLALTLVFVIFGTQHLYSALDAANANNVRLLAEEISGAINYMQLSESNIVDSIKLNTGCSVVITKKYVRVTNKAKGISATGNLVQTDVNIAPNSIDCGEFRRIEIVKTDSSISVSGVP